MKCEKCGKILGENEKFCTACGTKSSEPNIYTSPQYGAPQQTTHQVPKCLGCGYVGNWKKESILRPIDFVIGILLLFLGVLPGIMYIGIVILVRLNSNERAKICPRCKARNLWTFIY